ncbi:hypothetical protein LINPERPRIM_LOCUS37258 [Linum perenne]
MTMCFVLSTRAWRICVIFVAIMVTNWRLVLL